MKKLLTTALLSLLVVACDSQSPDASVPANNAAFDGQGLPAPASGTSRRGTSYGVFLTSASDKRIAITVFEPRDFVGGTRYPLILHSHGFGLSRATSPFGTLGPVGAIPSAIVSINDVLLGDIRPYLDAGYGVISIDQRGFGQSLGTVRVMDPDFEGQDLIQIVDWAEANLDWLSYKDGNVRLGAIGGSYGGGYQLLLNAIDPKRRLDAIVPQFTWHDLNYSLAPGDVPKSTYGALLGLAGESRLRFDPEFLQGLLGGVVMNRLSPELSDALGYHSSRYFCDGRTVPPHRPATAPPQVDALFLQGAHDVLFNINEGYANHQCLKRAGGDVRLFVDRLGGHPLPSGTGLLIPLPLAPDNVTRCGPYNKLDMSLAWFAAKLKDQPDALAGVPEFCVALDSALDAIAPSDIKVGGTPVSIPGRALALNLLGAVALPRTIYTADSEQVLAGIPTATLTLGKALGLPIDPNLPALGIDDPIIFVGLGHSRGLLPGLLDLMGDQIRPVRGLGTHEIELNGIAARLAPGDRIVLLVYGLHPQFLLSGSRDISTLLIDVEGEIRLPLLGAVPALPLPPRGS
ncbi:MAG: CocE/NonD family hydrolase [Panacagrimonas sp.]